MCKFLFCLKPKFFYLKAKFYDQSQNFMIQARNFTFKPWIMKIYRKIIFAYKILLINFGVSCVIFFSLNFSAWTQIFVVVAKIRNFLSKNLNLKCFCFQHNSPVVKTLHFLLKPNILLCLNSKLQAIISKTWFLPIFLFMNKIVAK